MLNRRSLWYRHLCNIEYFRSIATDSAHQGRLMIASGTSNAATVTLSGHKRFMLMGLSHQVPREKNVLVERCVAVHQHKHAMKTS